jgi:uncharacterized membrane protein YfcA
VDILYYVGIALTGYLSGLLGALLGLGGGLFIVSALRLIFGVPFLTAVGTSNMSVIATSMGGAATYVQNRLANIRLALMMLVATTTAALAASLIASFVPVQVLSALFAGLVVYTAISMRRKNKANVGASADALEDEQGEDIDRLGLGGMYTDAATGKVELYRPERVGRGVGVSALAGVVAGLLGVGGGIVQMPVMSLLMKVPVKVATGTSSFMIGITATSSALVRYAQGDIDPLMAVPMVLFVFLGARTGAWLVPRTPNAMLRQIFSWVALVVAGFLILQALGVYGR